MRSWGAHFLGSEGALPRFLPAAWRHINLDTSTLHFSSSSTTLHVAACAPFRYDKVFPPRERGYLGRSPQMPQPRQKLSRYMDSLPPGHTEFNSSKLRHHLHDHWGHQRGKWDRIVAIVYSSPGVRKCTLFHLSMHAEYELSVSVTGAILETRSWNGLNYYLPWLAGLVPWTSSIRSPTMVKSSANHHR